MTSHRACGLAIVTSVLSAAAGAQPRPLVERADATEPCPAEMALVEDRVCVDRWEASLVDLGPDGTERPHSPFEPADGLTVRAVSRADVIPQGYISGLQAGAACEAAGKRLCRSDEWLAACRGPQNWVYPYGNSYDEAACNVERPRHPLIEIFGRGPRTFSLPYMNDPRVNQLADSLARTGSFAACRSEWGVFDMVGNLHEWVADRGGTFRGGFYVDAHQNGRGCGYATTAHSPSYHDYSTGFRCCADPR